MFKRKKVQPETDTYISRRYEDTAVCIHYDIKNGRGMYSYYAPWLETMLQRLPSAQVRQKYSLMVRPVLSAWQEEEPGPSGLTDSQQLQVEDLEDSRLATFQNDSATQGQLQPDVTQHKRRVEDSRLATFQNDSATQGQLQPDVTRHKRRVEDSRLATFQNDSATQGQLQPDVTQHQRRGLNQEMKDIQTNTAQFHSTVATGRSKFCNIL